MDKQTAKNWAIVFFRWTATLIMWRLLFLPPNQTTDPFFRKLVGATIVYNLIVTFPGKTLGLRLTNSMTALFDLAFTGIFAYYSPIHNHYWAIFFMLPILYSGIDYGTDGASLISLAAAVSHGVVQLLKKYDLGLISGADQLIAESGPVLGFLLFYAFFGLVVGHLTARIGAEHRDGRKMRQVTEQLGATIRFLGVAGEKAQRSAEQLAAAINLIGTTAYSGVSVQSGMDSIFEQLIKGAVEVLQAERGMIMLVDEDGKSLSLKVSWGSACELLPHRVAFGEDVPGWVAQNGQSLIITRDNFPAQLTAACRNRQILDCLAAPIMIEGRVAGVLSLENKQSGTFGPEDMKVMNTVAGEAAMVIVNARLYQETMEKKEALERMIKEVQMAQEKERRRIARDLHDGTAQSLAQLALELGLLKMGLKKSPKKTITAIEKLEAEVESTVSDLRDLIYDLRPASLDNFGLVPTLEQYLKKFGGATGVKVKFKSNLQNRLPEEYEINLFRFTQESLNNIKKHAGVKKAEVELLSGNGRIELIIKDRGKGFDPKKVDVLDAKSRSFGLLGMKERIESVNGTVAIESTPGGGTTITAKLPAALREEVLVETG